jgi:hypothetical protein
VVGRWCGLQIGDCALPCHAAADGPQIDDSWGIVHRVRVAEAGHDADLAACGRVGVRDSKDKTGPALVMPVAAWSAFLAGVCSSRCGL